MNLAALRADGSCSVAYSHFYLLVLGAHWLSAGWVRCSFNGSSLFASDGKWHIGDRDTKIYFELSPLLSCVYLQTIFAHPYNKIQGNQGILRIMVSLHLRSSDNMSYNCYEQSM